MLILIKQLKLAKTTFMKKKIRMILFSPFHFINLLLGIRQFEKTGTNTVSHYQSLIRSFCFTLGKSSTWLAKRNTKQNPPNFANDNSGILKNIDYQLVNSQLDEKGFYIFDTLLDENTLSQLSKFAKEHFATTRMLSGGKSNVVEVIYDPTNKKSVRYDYKENDLINNETVQSLIGDSSIISIAQNYLRTVPIADVVGMWWNTDFQKEPDSEAAQFFHFDMDRIKWLKFFFYITDVDENSGPHSFVEGSHKDGGIPFSMSSKGYSRLSDKEVLDHYGQEKVKVFAAPKGTIIAEDTRGLHKGTNVIEGNRLIFQIQFSNSLFGAQYPKSKIDITNNSRLQLLDRNYPRILMNYK